LEIVDDPGDDTWSVSCTDDFMIRARNSTSSSGIRETFSDGEVKVLRLFAEPQQFGEVLFQCPKVGRLKSPREFLARCLRLKILVNVA